MATRRLYEYRGQEYTVSELARMSQNSRRMIQKRLDEGWEVHNAVETPTKAQEPAIDRGYIGQEITVIFTHPLPVIAAMQPVIGKKYTARVCGGTRRCAQSRVYFVLTLENGKKLITYPEECQSFLPPLQEAR